MDGEADALTGCPGCAGRYPAAAGGPVHRYMESSPGCWTVYGEVLAREYQHPSYFQAHKRTVDAYAVQHPGQPSPQSTQSIAVHLIRLCLIVEQGLDMDRAHSAMSSAARHKANYHWLAPPGFRGEITAADVHRATSAEEHVALVREWAASAWAAWAAHHETVRGWISAQAAGGRSSSR